MLLYLIRQWSRRRKLPPSSARLLRSNLPGKIQHRFATTLNKWAAALTPLQQKVALLLFLLLSGSLFILNVISRIGRHSRSSASTGRVITPAILHQRDTVSLEAIWHHLQLSKDSNHQQSNHNDTTKAIRKK